MRPAIILFITGLISLCQLPQFLTIAIAETDAVKHHAYYALMQSKRCKESVVQSITCTYNLGDGLGFSIEGVGEIDAAVTFTSVSPDSPYYARFAALPACVFIHRKSTDTINPIQAMLDRAYVSPRNGKVYSDWRECKEAR